MSQYYEMEKNEEYLDLDDYSEMNYNYDSDDGLMSLTDMEMEKMKKEEECISITESMFEKWDSKEFWEDDDEVDFRTNYCYNGLTVTTDENCSEGKEELTKYNKTDKVDLETFPTSVIEKYRKIFRRNCANKGLNNRETVMASYSRLAKVMVDSQLYKPALVRILNLTYNEFLCMIYFSNFKTVMDMVMDRSMTGLMQSIDNNPKLYYTYFKESDNLSIKNFFAKFAEFKHNLGKSEIYNNIQIADLYWTMKKKIIEMMRMMFVSREFDCKEREALSVSNLMNSYNLIDKKLILKKAEIEKTRDLDRSLNYKEFRMRKVDKDLTKDWMNEDVRFDLMAEAEEMDKLLVSIESGCLKKMEDVY